MGSLVGRMLALIPAGALAGPSDYVADFDGDESRLEAAAAEILGATLLAEHSDAEARTAAATVARLTAIETPAEEVTLTSITA